MLQKIILLLCTYIISTESQYYGNYSCSDGRDVFVQLFEWRWTDIEAACPSLADMGYCAVQVSPPQEHPLLETQFHPWWQRWQAVSYILTSRAGDELDFQNMVAACNQVGVRIYVDSIFNHMTGESSGYGSAGSYYDAGNEGGQSYEGVPYDEADFNGRDMCNTTDMVVGDTQEIHNIRNCRLVGLRDLRLSSEFVRDQIRGYLQKLIDYGVSGILPSAAKNMWPEDLAIIYNSLTGSPFIYQEVLDFGTDPISASEYVGMGRIAEWKYGIFIGETIQKINGSKLSDVKNIPTLPGFVDGNFATVFVDNQDTQRGHWISSPEAVLNFKFERQYKLANAFMLAFDYGYPAVMSSFNFTNGDQGPPSDASGITEPVDCSSPDWICEHTWPQIVNMVKFHNAMVGEPVHNWWDNDQNAIAFSRGEKGFIAINNEENINVTQEFVTGLAAGTYCNAFNCDTNSPPCNLDLPGCESIDVNEDGIASLVIPGGTDNSVVAIYL